MPKRYIIALIPTDSTAENALYQLAQGFYPIDHYQLQPGKSYPHASLAQVEIPAEDNLDETLLFSNINWQEAYSLALSDTLFTKADNWHELRFTAQSRDNILPLHYALKAQCQSLGLTLKNKSGPDFTPHFTLAKTTHDTGVFELPENLLAKLTAPFCCRLIVGEADNFWQLTQIHPYFSFAPHKGSKDDATPYTAP